VSAQDRSLPEFARQVQIEDEGARAAELGLRALHAELVEQRSPERAVTARARQALELGDEVARRRLLRLMREEPEPEPEAGL
jgi:hypothetical protein